MEEMDEKEKARMDRIIELQQKKRTKEEEAELQEFYKEQANACDYELQQQLKEQADPLVSRLKEIHAEKAGLVETSEDVQTLLSLRKERGKITKLINKQAKKDAVKTLKEYEKGEKETKKELNDLKKRIEAAGGEYTVPSRRKKKKKTREKSVDTASPPTRSKKRRKSEDKSGSGEEDSGTDLRFAEAE